MSKYTKEQVIAERRCGLKYFDKAAPDEKSRKELIMNAIAISKKNPMYVGWSNFSWALGNAIIEIVAKDKEILQFWNTDEVLSQEEMLFVAKELNLKMEDYVDVWKRKTSFVEIQKLHKIWSEGEQNETLAQMLKPYGWTKKEYLLEEQKRSLK